MPAHLPSAATAIGFASIAFATVLAAQEPKADLTVTLRDHNFKLTNPVPRGHATWHVRNEGTEPHQALVIKLPDRVSEYAEKAWLANNRGPEPGESMGGVPFLKPGSDAWFTTDLAPGRYLLLCAMQEEEGRHFDLGMIYRFTIK
jgi:hypothetical protein